MIGKGDIQVLGLSTISKKVKNQGWFSIKKKKIFQKKIIFFLSTKGLKKQIFYYLFVSIFALLRTYGNIVCITQNK
jgi:hypothetical protein